MHCPSNSSHSRGVSIFFRTQFECETKNHHISQDGRRILINFNYNKEDFTIVNIYAPNNEQERIQFFKKLSTWIPQNADNENGIILCGDFNSTLTQIDRNTRKLDRTASYLQNLK